MMGGGGFLSSIFGGGQSAPAPVTYEAEAAPREAEQEAEATSTRDEEKRKLRQRRQLGGTLLTSPLGVTGASNATGASLLGRSDLGGN